MAAAASESAYGASGVDIDAANRAMKLISGHVASTHGPRVLGGLGYFGGLYALGEYHEPVLVASVDGVGTKVRLGTLTGQLTSLGHDLVSHCVNDILTCGATPLFFLDYFAAARLVPEQLERVVAGMAEACRAVGCALIGGETAEMPGVYAEGQLDLVGCIVGVVESDAIIDGSRIATGDLIVGLPSSGLHTNGYSLVRRVFGVGADEPPDVGRARLEQFYPELGRTLGEELLESHRCYYGALKPHLDRVKGLAHITGGGLLENVPRILPDGLAARFRRGSWAAPPIFHLIQERGDIADAEMYRVFNMGLGMVGVCAPEAASALVGVLHRGEGRGASVVGEIVAASGGERVILE